MPLTERALLLRLSQPLARWHGLHTLWITVNPDNAPSRRVCESLGCELVETVELPDDNPQRQAGDTHKCRYRMRLGDG